MEPARRPLFCRHGRTVACKFRIEHGALCQRNRIDSLIPIDDIQHKEQGNMVRLSFHIRALNPFYIGCSIDPQHRTGQMAVAFPEPGTLLRLRPCLFQRFHAVKPVAGYLKELSCFLLQAHII